MDYLRRIRLIGLIDWFLPGALLAVALMAADPGPSAPAGSAAGNERRALPFPGKLPQAASLRLISTGEDMDRSARGPMDRSARGPVSGGRERDLEHGRR